LIDSLRTALIVGSISTVVAVACAGYVAWENRNSRNIALAVLAFAGAAIGTAATLGFELRSSSTESFITADFTVDRAKPQIRQWRYGRAPSQRVNREIAASDRYFAARPAPFNGDREKLVHDMVIFSLLSYFGVEQPDWQIRRAQFTSSREIATTATRLSRPQECTSYSGVQLQGILRGAKNGFADTQIIIYGGQLCLPPNSSIKAQSNALSLITPFCTVSFVLEPSGGVSYYEPGNSLNQPVLTSGEPALETRLTGIRVTTKYSALRAQSPDMPKYREWSERVVAGAKAWFEGEDRAKDTAP
jgi:hypothetical protein